MEKIFPLIILLSLVTNLNLNAEEAPYSLKSYGHFKKMQHMKKQISFSSTNLLTSLLIVSVEFVPVLPINYCRKMVSKTLSF